MKRGLILVLVFLFSISFVYATDCAVRTSCLANEINVLNVSSLSNAHVSSNNINYMQLCCPNSQISSSTVSATCSQTNPLKLYSLDNTHVEVPVAIGYISTGIYNYKLCVDSSLICRVSDGFACSPEEFCLLKFKENAGMTNTNAHVADCNDPQATFYSKRICCSSSETCVQQNYICLTDDNCCQTTTNPASSFDQYCSYGQYGDLTEGHCCKIGWYYDSTAGECTSAFPCYNPENPLGDPNLCNYDLATNPHGYFSLDAEDCIVPAGEHWDACCNKMWYGTNGGYYFCPITSVN